jgi:sec-independent protein translocase protein TatA
MMGLRTPELLLILLVVLVLFGASRLPALGKGLGEGMRSFKKAFGGGDDDKTPEQLPPSKSQEPAAKEPSESQARR